MIKTFREISEAKTVSFCSLAAGDCFYFDNTYYMKLVKEYISDDDSYNSVDLKSGVLTFFSSKARVKPYKDCEVILHE